MEQQDRVPGIVPVSEIKEVAAEYFGPKGGDWIAFAEEIARRAVCNHIQAEQNGRLAALARLADMGDARFFASSLERYAHCSGDLEYSAVCTGAASMIKRLVFGSEIDERVAAADPDAEFAGCPFKRGQHFIPRRVANGSNADHATVWRIAGVAKYPDGSRRYYGEAPGFGAIAVAESEVVITDLPVSRFPKYQAEAA